MERILSFSNIYVQYTFWFFYDYSIVVVIDSGDVTLPHILRQTRKWVGKRVNQVIVSTHNNEMHLIIDKPELRSIDKLKQNANNPFIRILASWWQRSCKQRRLPKLRCNTFELALFEWNITRDLIQNYTPRHCRNSDLPYWVSINQVFTNCGIGESWIVWRWLDSALFVDKKNSNSKLAQFPILENYNRRVAGRNDGRILWHLKKRVFQVHISWLGFHSWNSK